jgi:hypothetical protein
MKDGKLFLESQMPVEECGNMILVTALYTAITGKWIMPENNGDFSTVGELLKGTWQRPRKSIMQ